MKKGLPTAAMLLAAFVIQAGFAPYLAIGGVVPNFLLLAVITLALVQGPNAGTTLGFAAGLLFDLLGSGPVGPMTLVLSITGYFAGTMHEAIFAEGWLLPLTVLAIASLMTGVAYVLMLDLLGTGGALWSIFFTRIVPGAVYNTVLALLIYPWLARFLRQDQPMKTFRRLA
ncbi:MAG: rod shape-determining protein MreD [Coriobacteriia bacterium]|nr:rod shape-determining protein MreD [Coriobacteriia bacterium]